MGEVVHKVKVQGKVRTWQDVFVCTLLYLYNIALSYNTILLKQLILVKCSLPQSLLEVLLKIFKKVEETTLKILKGHHLSWAVETELVKSVTKSAVSATKQYCFWSNPSIINWKKFFVYKEITVMLSDVCNLYIWQNVVLCTDFLLWEDNTTISKAIFS